jgi:hypothetical protein
MTDDRTKNPDFSPLSWPDDYFMNRNQAAALSRSLGLPVAGQYLAKLHCVASNGPPTVHFGRQARLRVGDFKQWLYDRTSAPHRSTSESYARPKGATCSETDAAPIVAPVRR